MNSEFLLECVGLIDDDLIADAEQPVAKRPVRWSYWSGLAACLVLAAVLGYGVTHLDLGMGGAGNSAAPAASAPAGSTPAASTPAPATSTPAAPEPGASPQEPSSGEMAGGAPQEGEQCPAIMVDGVVYRSTGNPVPGEPDPSVIRTSGSYTDGEPVEDGQNNFSRESVQYAQTDLGVVVLMDHEWVLFTPDPPGP